MSPTLWLLLLIPCTHVCADYHNISGWNTRAAYDKSWMQQSNRTLHYKFAVNKVYIVSASKGIFVYEQDDTSARVGFLCQGYAFIAMEHFQGLRVSYPVQGYIHSSSRSKIVELQNNHNPQTLGSRKMGLTDADRLAIRIRSEACLLVDTPPGLGNDGWQNQWPVGSGRIGALVGGSIQEEVIPFSSEGFFVVRNKPPAQQIPADAARNFATARVKYQSGYLEESADYMSKTISPYPLGEFQYVFDLTLIFNYDWPSGVSTAPSDMYSGKSRRGRLANTLSTLQTKADHALSLKLQPISPKLAVSKHQQWRRLRDRRQVPTSRGRAATRPGSNRNDNTNGNKQSDATPPRVLHYRRSLDTYTGIASSTHVVEDSKGQNEELQYHHREWFASSVDDVVVGEMSCRVVHKVASGAMSGCFDASTRLSRDMVKQGNRGATVLDESNIRIVPWSVRREYSGHGKNDNETDKHVMWRAFSLTLRPELPKFSHRGAEVCGVVMCMSSSEEQAEMRSFTVEGLNFIRCSYADKMVVISSVITGNYTPDQVSMDYIRHMDDARALCWSRVEGAVELGVDQLRKRHIESFTSAMGQTIVHLGTGSKENRGACANGVSTVSSQFKCLRLASESKSNYDGAHVAALTRLTTNAVWFGRYLLLSSASHAVANLQGIWTDGPESAWSGDYHLNINLQMMYWSSHSMGLGARVLPPLIRWIENLAKAGEMTAQAMYQCPGWVGHGFTDNLLNTGVRGGIEWALCVTCGAWVASHLWDHACNVHDESFLREVMLPVHRSLAAFFLSYMFESSDGYFHTGPTTSPETSYKIKGKRSDGKPANRLYHQVTTSPAIDMSILRQAANAYVMTIEWLEMTSGSESTNLTSDKEQAVQFKNIVQKMINSANPVVSPHNGLILEFPSWQAHKDAEMFDQGHRHFSSLHWLYPGTFIPNTSTQTTSTSPLFQAAEKTLVSKIAAGGGHTGWSSMWEACLWARLRKGSQTGRALNRALSKYFTTEGLMGLHPKLIPTTAGCGTCFTQPKQFPQGKSAAGMATRELDVFQMDANMGLLAAVGEMVLQSHEPGVLRALPALAQDMYPSGFVADMHCRGGYRASLQWSEKILTGLLLDFDKWHPWLVGQLEPQPGYFTTAPSSASTTSEIPPQLLTVIVPNAMRRVNFSFSEDKLSESSRADSNACATVAASSHLQSQRGVVFDIHLKSFPCSVAFCPEDYSDCSSSNLSILRINRALTSSSTRFMQ